jgi:hypothetical protein
MKERGKPAFLTLRISIMSAVAVLESLSRMDSLKSQHSGYRTERGSAGCWRQLECRAFLLDLTAKVDSRIRRYRARFCKRTFAKPHTDRIPSTAWSLLARPIAEVDSSIRRYRARFCSDHSRRAALTN